MKVFNQIDQTIGNTPLIRLNNLEKELNLKARIFAKLEYFNPAGSVKDRVAKYMIDDAEQKGLLVKGSTIIEPTSGNTGIGLAMIGAARGYKVILTMPETMSLERQKLLKAFGATVVLTKGELGMQGSIDKAKELAKEIKNSFIPFQFENSANPKAHYETTAKEIYSDLDGNIDIFVACVGSGGTVSGISQFLKEQNKDVLTVAVEPSSSPLISKGVAGLHKIQGIGANFIPKNYYEEFIDLVKTASDEDAYKFANMVAKTEGVLVGISSGAGLKVAVELANLKENENKNIVVVFADSGERYLSTDLY